jgi:tight adherence protein B
MTLVFALAGAGIAAGLLLMVDGLDRRPRTYVARRSARKRHMVDVRGRLLPSVGLGVPSVVVTRWPVAGAALAAVGWFAPDLFGSKAEHDRATARTEAVAAWTEMLRDTMSGAHGLEEAIITTASVAPDAIAAEVAGLALRLDRQPLDAALQGFAADLAHPTADLVVASLTLASRGTVGDLGELLGTLAQAARDEAGMRLRVDAARARLRTAVRVIAGCTAATGLGLILLNRRYLDVYRSVTGQVVLAFIAACWGLSLRWLAGMGRFVAPERFLASSPRAEAQP